MRCVPQATTASSARIVPAFMRGPVARAAGTTTSLGHPGVGTPITPSARSARSSSTSQPSTPMQHLVARARRGAVPDRGPRAGVSERRNGGPSMRTVRPSGVGDVDEVAARGELRIARAHVLGVGDQAGGDAGALEAVHRDVGAPCARPRATQLGPARPRARTVRRAVAKRGSRPRRPAHRGDEAAPFVVREHRDRDPAIVAGAGVDAVRRARRLPATRCRSATTSPPSAARASSTGPSRLATASSCARSTSWPRPVRRRCQSAARTASAPRFPPARSEYE